MANEIELKKRSEKYFRIGEKVKIKGLRGNGTVAMIPAERLDLFCPTDVGVIWQRNERSKYVSPVCYIKLEKVPK